MKPVFEYFALFNQLLEKFRLVILDSRPEYVVVGAFHHGYGVDLYIAELFYGAQRGAFATAEKTGL